MRESAAGTRALLAAGIGFSWIVFYGAWLVVQPGGDEVLRVFADTAYLLPLATAAALCVYAWRKVPKGLRPFWALMTAATTAWLAADTLWCIRDLVAGSVPYPWWSDAGYIASYALLLGAVYAAFRPRFRTVGAERLLDGVLMVGAIALAWWWLLLRPIEFEATLTSFFDLAYPGSALLLIGLLVTVRLLPSRQGTLAMWLVAAGVVAGVFADAAYVYSSEHGGYLTGAWIEVAWETQGVLFSLAALFAAGGLGRPPDWMTFHEWPRLTPAILTSIVVSVEAVLLAADAAEDGWSRGLLAGVGLLSLLLLIRLWLAVSPKREATTDPETGAYDAGYFGDRLRHHAARGRHFAEPFALALAAPDGSPASTAGSTFFRASREVDTVSHLGDGRFGILLPRAEAEEALQIAEALREEIAQLETTYSIGLASWSPELAARDLIGAAGDALAWARRLGGNQVRHATAEDEDEWSALVSVALLVDRREGLPAGHSEQVASLAAAVAERLGLDERTCTRAHAGGYLHDVGKVGLPTSLLRKPQMLDSQEWETIKRHPERGATIVEGFGSLREVAPIVCAHHERWDGSGYPRGIAGAEIPVEARVVAVVNSVVSMTSDRAHRLALSETSALTTVWQQSGQAYDPAVVRALLALSGEGRLPRLQPPAGRSPIPANVPAASLSA